MFILQAILSASVSGLSPHPGSPGSSQALWTVLRVSTSPAVNSWILFYPEELEKEGKRISSEEMLL